MALEDTVYTYVSNSEIDEFFKALLDDATWTYTNIPELIRGGASTRGSAFEQLRAALDGYVDAGNSTEETILYDGTGIPELFVKFPIVSITSITILEPDDTEYILDDSGADKDFEYNPDDGFITLKRNVGINGQATTGNELVNWPKGLQNVRIIGTFGYQASPLFKYAQLLYILQAMSMYNPTVYRNYIAMPKTIKIGRFQKQYSEVSTQAGSLVDNINSVVDQLTKLTGNGSCYESI